MYRTKSLQNSWEKLKKSNRLVTVKRQKIFFFYIKFDHFSRPAETDPYVNSILHCIIQGFQLFLPIFSNKKKTSCRELELYSRNFHFKALCWLNNFFVPFFYLKSGGTKGCHKKSRVGPSIKQWRRSVIDASQAWQGIPMHNATG